MPLTRADNRNASGAQYVLASAENFLVSAGISVLSTDALAVYATSPGAHVIRIDGTIASASVNPGSIGALLCGVQGVAGPAYVFVGKTGVLSARRDVVGSWAIGLQAADSILENHGVITADIAVSFNARSVHSVDSPGTVVINSGIIDAGTTALYHPSNINASEYVSIINTGKIFSGEYVLNADGAEGWVTFVNHGIAQGDIRFGANLGTYDGSLGLLLAAPGAVGPASISGDGTIVVMPGRSAEKFDFTNCNGEISFRKSPTGVRFALDKSLTPTGAVNEGDIYIRSDKVWLLTGARFGDDWLRGSERSQGIHGLGGKDLIEGLAGVDELYGGAGRDTLSGGEGRDYLYGGAGRDVLFGGADVDVFTFYFRTDFGDQISDFAAEDTIRVSAEILGLPPRPTPDERASTDDEFRLTLGGHRALDRGDRFIYDAKSTQLWFDPDGSGRRKAVLLADLSPGVLLNAEGIIVRYFTSIEG